MQVLNLALTIADATVRADVELYAREIELPEGRVAYDLSRPASDSRTTDAEHAEGLAAAQRAARYIQLRGNVWPWRMVRWLDNRSIVCFVDEEVP